MKTDQVYQITRQEYDALHHHLAKIQEILDSAVVIEREQQQMRVAVKEHLTPHNLPILFGANYRGLLVYDFENNQWSANKYLQFMNRAVDTGRGIGMDIKHGIDTTVGINDVELVALVTMVINGADFAGWCEPVPTPVFSPKGTAAVATLVTRSRGTGKLMPIPSRWVGISDCNSQATAVQKCFGALNLLAESQSIFRKTLIEHAINKK